MYPRVQKKKQIMMKSSVLKSIIFFLFGATMLLWVFNSNNLKIVPLLFFVSSLGVVLFVLKAYHIFFDLYNFLPKRFNGRVNSLPGPRLDEPRGSEKFWLNFAHLFTKIVKIFNVLLMRLNTKKHNIIKLFINKKKR